MLTVSPDGQAMHGYIETDEELERVAKILDKTLYPCVTKNFGRGFYLNSDNGDVSISTFVGVGSFIILTGSVREVAPEPTPQA